MGPHYGPILCMATRFFLLPEIVRMAKEICAHDALLISRAKILAEKKKYVPYMTPAGDICLKLDALPDLRVVDVLHGLLPIVEKKTGLKIQVRRFKQRKEDCEPYGYVELYAKEKRAEIFVSTHNLCWTRFTIAKELMQLWLDFEDLDADISGLIKEARAARDTAGINENTQLSEELAAFYLALEVMIPEKTREKQFDALAQESDYFIAQSYLIPQRFVELFRVDNYSALSFKLHRQNG